MIKKVLLINSDLATNRGDRAIAEGNIQLIKERFPDATITGLSEKPQRDRDWFGIDFLNMNFQSLSPLAFARLWRAARKNDLVLWGGGEILKDYTNKAALWYWVIKMTVLSLANHNLYGAYQGVGPTKSRFSKKLISYVVNRSKKFIVRDQESADKLIAWGAKSTKVLAASDPAVLPLPLKIDSKLSKKLASSYKINDDFLNNFICIGPRDWFHYKPGGIIPFRYKKMLLKLVGKSQTNQSTEHALYIKNLTELINQLTKKYNTNILLVPMHMSESDKELCRLLADHADSPGMVRILDEDNLAPSELRSVIAKAQAMIGFRLHSNIIGISAGVPSMNIYYVDKGRVFFDQIKQSRYAMPIETVLKDDFVTDALVLFDNLYSKRTVVKKSITSATTKLRHLVTSTFTETFK